MVNDPLTPPDFDHEDQLQRVLTLLRQGPLPAPPAAAVRAAKDLISRHPARMTGPIQHLAETIAVLIFDSRAAPALAGFRGSAADTPLHLIYRTELAEVDLQIQPAHGDAPLTRILAQVESQLPARSAHLLHADTTAAAEAQINSRGIFSFTIAPGRYDLTITLADASIRIPSLEL
jgi:hypothetical protein